MTTIPSAIASLLYDHDTVIVPGLGAFVRHDQSARVNVITNEFQRPSSSLVFNPQQREENALVSDFLMACDGLTDDDARTAVASFVNDCFAQLKENRMVTLPELGTLSYDENDNLVFEPVGDVNFNSDAFGLDDLNPQPVFVSPEPVGKRNEFPEKEPMLDTRIPHDETEHHRRLWWIWLLLFLLAAAGVALWYFKFRPVPTKPWPIKPLPTMQSRERVLPQHKTPETPETPFPADTIETTKIPVSTEIPGPPVSTVTPEPSTTPETPETSETPETPETNPTNTSEPLMEPQPTVPVEVITPPAEAKAFIVGGCFSIEKNALNMTVSFREQGCTDAFVMKRGTLYYVCYGYYPSTADAKAALPEILKNYNDKAWILKK